MLRLKYYSLSKEEQTKLKKEFYETVPGKNIDTRLKRLLITGTFGVLFSIYLIFRPANNWDIYTGCILLVVSLIFIVASFRVRITKLNNYLVSKKK